MKKTYIFKSEIRVPRSILFLCGSFFAENKSDKRYILRSFIESTFKNDTYPLIVDNFLSEDNIETNDFSIKQYEELVANVSFLNFIFLESFSSASELGLFSNSSSSTKNIVFYPDSSNLILDKAGYYIKFGVLQNNKNVVAESYLSLVERYAHGSDYIDEHYYFFDDKLPENIKSIVEREIEATSEKTYSPKFRFQKDINTTKLDFFTFDIYEELNKVRTSSQTAFYILYSFIMRDNTYENIVSLELSNEDVEKYETEIKTAIVNSALLLDNISIDSSIELNVLGFSSTKDFIKCASFFIKYMTVGMFLKKKTKRAQLISIDDIFAKIDFYKAKENLLFDFPDNLDSISKLKLIKKFTIYKNHRARKIVTYFEQDNALHVAHKAISKLLKRFAGEHNLFSLNSFAYKESLNTKECVSKHLGSVYFLKLDIHHFFESMNPSFFISRIESVFSSSSIFNSFTIKEKTAFKNKLKNMVDITTINNSFPIGFVTSPIISEIYLSDFDRHLDDFCNENGLIYTRYADDLLLSSKDDFDKDLVLNIIKERLNSLSLDINVNKTRKVDLAKEGDNINYLGLNIVKTKDWFRISIGKSFLRKLIKLKLYSYKDEYTVKKIAGLENYLKYNDLVTYQKYLSRIKS